MSNYKHIEITKDVSSEYENLFGDSLDSRHDIVSDLITSGLDEMSKHARQSVETSERDHYTCTDEVKIEIDEYCKNNGGKKYEVASNALKIGMKIYKKTQENKK